MRYGPTSHIKAAFVAVALSSVAVVAPTHPLIASAAASTYSETTGGYTHTWTNYNNAGGVEGPTINPYTAVQIACKLTGFRVADGNTWWYRIASDPWNGNHYASADAFYNNGQTSGSLRGTPFVDPAVPDCGAAQNPPPPPAPPAPSPSVSLARGPAAPHGYWYAMTLDHFAGNAGVSVSCRDSKDPDGFRTFSLTTDGSGHTGTQGGCYSGDGPDHWVMANGVESNHIAWGSSSGGGGGNPPPPPNNTGGGGGGSSSGSQQTSPGTTPSHGTVTEPCIAAYRDGGNESTHSIFGGTETNFDRTASLYQVCEGFGAPDGLSYSPAMKCALIAAAATFGGPAVNVGVEKGCELGDYYTAYQSRDWLGAVSSKACGFFGGVFAKGVGIFAAGAASETGPGAVAVGARTYKALAASLKVACSGLLDGGAATLGYNLEDHYESHVALDITRTGKCLRERRVFGFITWSAANC